MVTGIKGGGGIRGPAPAARDAAETVTAKFVVTDGAGRLTQTARASSVAGIALDSMLALQAVDEATERNRSARKRGTAMLGALTKLQRAMLAGGDSAEVLRTLNELNNDTAVADDPGLAAIVRAIILRSRVELALRGSPDA
jgi:hypothetical protein